MSQPLVLLSAVLSAAGISVAKPLQRDEALLAQVADFPRI